MLTAGRKIDDLVPVAQRALERDNALSAHAQELCCPEGAPLRVVCGIRYARIEANLIEAPPSRRTDCGSECNYIVIRKGISEGGTDRVEKILPVEEGDSALDGRFAGQKGPSKNNNPARAFRHVGRGANSDPYYPGATPQINPPIARKKPCLEGQFRRAQHALPRVNQDASSASIRMRRIAGAGGGRA